MELSFLQVSIAMMALAAIAQTSVLQPTVAADGPDIAKEFVDAHNAARKTVGAPPVKWNDTLAAFAESYAAKRAADCAPQHSEGPHGENIAMASAKLSPADSVKLWMDEKKYYDETSNTCTGGECHHYTQLVWKDSTSIGCARSTCKTGWMFVTCNYDPPGNYVGERPY